MGNEFAKNNSVHVRLSRPFYSPGDRVDGTVFLNVVEPFCCTAFFLRISGREAVFWNTSKLINDHSETATSFASLLNTTIDIEGLRGDVLPGQHAFPFNFTLPQHTPGSFLLRVGKYSSQVSFQIVATCTAKGILLQKELQSKQFMIVFEPAPHSEVVPQPVVIRKPITLLGLANRGHITMQVQLLKDQVIAGDSVKMTIHLDNGSQNVDVLRLRVCVRQSSNFKTTAFGRDQLDVSIHDVPYVLKAGQSTSMEISLNLLPTTPQTMFSRLIECRYRVIAEAFLSGALNTNIETSQPITIYARTPSATAQVQAVPAGFSIEQHPMTNIALPALPSYEEGFGEATTTTAITSGGVPGDLPAYDDLTPHTVAGSRQSAPVDSMMFAEPPPAYA